jgi:hypothetical protein
VYAVHAEPTPSESASLGDDATRRP